MAKKKPSDTKELLNRNYFWLGQYQVRNPRYIALDNELAQIEDIFKSFDSRTVGFEDQYAIYDLWGEDILFSNAPVESYEKFPAELVKHALRSREITQEIKENFPRACEHVDPIEIYISEKKNSFPPKLSWESHKSFVQDYIPKVHVPFTFDDKYRNILRFEVDCTEPTSTIIDTIRLRIEQYKEYLKNPDPDHIFEKDPSLPRHEDLMQECLVVEVENDLGFQLRDNVNEQRAIGLLAYDLAARGLSSNLRKIFDAAYGEIVSRAGRRWPPRVGKGDDKYKDWYYWLKNAERCVEAGKVLKIKGK
jgi:hypothetical protein